jgi:hypothetical protein
MMDFGLADLGLTQNIPKKNRELKPRDDQTNLPKYVRSFSIPLSLLNTYTLQWNALSGRSQLSAHDRHFQSLS